MARFFNNELLRLAATNVYTLVSLLNECSFGGSTCPFKIRNVVTPSYLKSHAMLLYLDSISEEPYLLITFWSTLNTDFGYYLAKTTPTSDHTLVGQWRYHLNSFKNDKDEATIEVTILTRYWWVNKQHVGDWLP